MDFRVEGSKWVTWTLVGASRCGGTSGVGGGGCRGGDGQEGLGEVGVWGKKYVWDLNLIVISVVLK